MKKITLIFLLLQFSHLLNAQDYKKDILEVTRNMCALKNYRMRIDYKLFVDNKFNKPFQQRRMDVYRMDANLLLKKDNGDEVMLNRDYQVVVSKQAKSIVVSKPQAEEYRQKEKEKFQTFMNENLNTILEMVDDIKVFYSNSTKICYELTYNSYSEIEKAWVTINLQQKRYESVKCTYRKPRVLHELGQGEHKVTMETSYSNPELQSITNVSLFNTKKYFRLKDGKEETAEEFKGYKLTLLNP